MSTHCPIRIIVCVLQSFDFILSLLRYHAITLLTKSKVSNWTQDRLFLNEKVTTKKQNQNYLKPCVPCLVIFFKFQLTNISVSLLFCTSAGKPKKPHALKTICLMLGPDFITDIIEVGMSYKCCQYFLLNLGCKPLSRWLPGPGCLKGG